MMGYIPLLFQKLRLNKISEQNVTKSLLFSSSILSLKKAEDFKKSDDPSSGRDIRKNIYRQSILVGGVDPKTKDDRLEFLLSKETYNNDEDNKKLDETMGTFNE